MKGKLRKWAPAFAVLIAVVIGAAGLGIGILQTHASTVPEDVIVEATPTPTPSAKPTPSPTPTPTPTPTPEPEMVDVEVDDDVVNILLLGMDARSYDVYSRSDTMILASYNKTKHEVKLVSFLRDSWVDIPGYGWNRLNAATAFGGPELLIDTLKTNFDLDIDHYAQIKFDDFKEIIDRLMRPQKLPILDFVQFRNSDAVFVAWDVLCHDIHSDFREVQIRTDATRRRNAVRTQYRLNDPCHQFVWRYVVERSIRRHIDEHFVDTIYVNVLRREKLQVDAVYFRRHLQISRHTRHRDDIVDVEIPCRLQMR